MKRNRSQETMEMVAETKGEVHQVPTITAPSTTAEADSEGNPWFKKKEKKKTSSAVVAAGGALKIPDHRVGRTFMYERWAPQYDLLMDCHDCSLVRGAILAVMTEQGFLPRAATPTTTTPPTCDGSGLVSPSLSLADLGCGTGRLGVMMMPWLSKVLSCDKAQGMLDVCGQNLIKARDAVGYSCSSGTEGEGGEGWISDLRRWTFEDLAELHSPMVVGKEEATTTVATTAATSETTPPPAWGSYNLVTCGWSLSYVMNAQWGDDRWHASMERTLAAMEALLPPRALGAAKEGEGDTKEQGAEKKATAVPRGVIVIIETLGTAVTEPTRKNALHTYLQERHGFSNKWVRTDYTFASKDQGRQLCRFFFGDGIVKKFDALGEEELTLPECTGVWSKVFY